MFFCSELGNNSVCKIRQWKEPFLMQEKLLRPSPLLRQNYFMPPFFCLLFEPQEEEVASQSIKQEKYGNIGDNTKNQAAEQGEGSTKNKNNDVKAKTPLLSSHCHMELCTSILTISGLLCRLFLQSDDCKMRYNRCSFLAIVQSLIKVQVQSKST